MEHIQHKKIQDMVMGANHPVLVSDVRVDGDSLGSAMAMYHFLRTHGKHAEVFVEESVPDQYRFLPDVQVCSSDRDIFLNPAVDLVIVFDCSEAAFVESLVSLMPNRPQVINIDHHKTNPLYGDVNQVLTDAAATTEVLYRFFEANHTVITKETATCLLAGLCFDTNMFSNSATHERALAMAGSLVSQGARVQDVIRTMFQNRSIQALHVWGAALERLTNHTEFNVMSTVLTRKDIETHNVTDDEIDGLSNFLNLVADTETLIVLRETKEGGVKVSMRSFTKDVSRVAKRFSGGGHAKAAGCTFTDCRLKMENGVWGMEENGHIVPIKERMCFSEFF